MYLYGTQLTTILLGITLGILVVRYLTMPILNQLHLVSVLQVRVITFVIMIYFCFLSLKLVECYLVSPPQHRLSFIVSRQLLMWFV